MDLIQLNGQPQYGRFTQIPKQIDYAKAQYKNSQGNVLTGWRKRLKYKKFKFCSIQHEHYTIGLAIADIAWVGHAFVYIYDHSSQQMLQWNARQLFARHMYLDEQPLYNQSYFHKSPCELSIQHANGVRYIHLSKYGELKLSARIFCAGTDPLSMCYPSGEQGWCYTQKLTTLGCEGFFVNKQGKHITFDARSFASLNDSCGFLSSELTRTWLSCNFWDAEQNRVGLNLTSGHSVNAENQNSLWFNGRLYALPDVDFQPRLAQQWQICSVDGTVNLTISTDLSCNEKLLQHVLGQEVRQWQAQISGYILHLGQRIDLHEVLGLFEQHNSPS